MTIQEKYQNESLDFLINIIENHQDYTKEAVELAKTEIVNRKPEKENVVEISRTIITQKIREYLDDFSSLNDEIILPKSIFLKEEEIEEIFNQEFEVWKERKDALRPNGLDYITGAIL
ncbi:MAG: hypothetical protein JEZ03_11745 [Bacteroidales bacterium]|nr:hypothetical protein [Bacteroidales bacterium]